MKWNRPNSLVFFASLGAAGCPSDPSAGGPGTDGSTDGTSTSASASGPTGSVSTSTSTPPGTDTGMTTGSTSAATGEETGTTEGTDTEGDCAEVRAGVCGRFSDGVHCAVSNGADGFEPPVLSERFRDVDGWDAASRYLTVRFVDVNGDGLADACSQDGTGIACALATSEGDFELADEWTPAFGDTEGFDTGDHYATIAFPDLDGDGAHDVCGRSNAEIVCALSNGDGFDNGVPWADYFSNAAGWDGEPHLWGTIQYPDVNGDGNADVCGRDTVGIVCGLSDGIQFEMVTLWTQDGAFSDANGYAGDPSYWGTIQFPDITGDGQADVCARSSVGLVCGISDGTEFGTTSTWSDVFSDANGWIDDPHHWGTIQFPDLDGDGAADVCGRAGDGVWCGLSDGAGEFVDVQLWTQGGSFSDANGYGGEPSFWGTLQYVDLDEDGDDDLCGRSAAGISCALSDGSAFGTTSLWLDGFTDAAGWDQDPNRWRTIRLARLLEGSCAAPAATTVLDWVSSGFPPRVP